MCRWERVDGKGMGASASVPVQHRLRAVMMRAKLYFWLKVPVKERAEAGESCMHPNRIKQLSSSFTAINWWCRRRRRFPPPSGMVAIEREYFNFYGVWPIRQEAFNLVTLYIKRRGGIGKGDTPEGAECFRTCFQFDQQTENGFN